jgi:hypothetical protein
MGLFNFEKFDDELDEPFSFDLRNIGRKIYGKGWATINEGTPTSEKDKDFAMYMYDSLFPEPLIPDEIWNWALHNPGQIITFDNEFLQVE